LKALLLLFLFSISLFAGPPMKSSDPFVPSLGEFEINVAVEGEYKENDLVRAPILDANYGIMKNVQLTLESAYVSSDSQDGFDSFEVAIKWLFYEDDFFAIALYPKYKSYPIDSIFNEGETYELTVPMNFALSEKLDFIVDLTYVYHPNHSGEHLEFGSYVKYKNNKHTYYLEIFMEGKEHQKQFFVLGNIGYMYQFHERVGFMISVGKEITYEEKRGTIGYSGLQFVF